MRNREKRPGAAKPYLGVVFDLFGTLVPVFSYQKHDAVMRKIAKALDIDYYKFEKGWVGSYKYRILGKFKSTEENIGWIGTRNDVKFENDRIKTAMSLLSSFVTDSLVPQPGALKTLKVLKDKGYKVGLISDCAPTVPVKWPLTPFYNLIQAPFFSCLEKTCKPNPRIYRRCAKKLELSPDRCLYIGDGSSNELQGALNVGMDPVLITTDFKDTYDSNRRDVQRWKGKKIKNLREVLKFLKA